MPSIVEAERKGSEGHETAGGRTTAWVRPFRAKETTAWAGTTGEIRGNPSHMSDKKCQKTCPNPEEF